MKHIPSVEESRIVERFHRYQAVAPLKLPHHGVKNLYELDSTATKRWPH